MKQVKLETEKMLAWSEDGIGWMVFNNPARLNAMGVEMNAAIPTILHSFRDDPDVQCRGDEGRRRPRVCLRR